VTNISDEVKEGNMPEINKGLRIKGFKGSSDTSFFEK